MTDSDWQLLREWYEKNKDHSMNLLEKSAIKLAVGKAGTVADLMNTALSLLKK